MDLIKKAKVPILIISVFFIGFLIYNTVFKEKQTESGIETITEEASKRRAIGKDFTILLSLIKSVDFDEAFFKDPVFRSLVDFSEEVKEEEKTRENPFAPGILNSFNDVAKNIIVTNESEINKTATTTKTTATTTNQ